MFSVKAFLGRALHSFRCIAVVALWLSPLVSFAQDRYGLSSPSPSRVSTSFIGQTIAEVQIVGYRSVSEHEIRAELDTREGQAFDPMTVTRDVKNLTKTRKFFDVKVKTRPGPQPQTVVVVYEVFEFPRLEYVHFIGNAQITSKALRKQIELKEGDARDTSTIETAQRKIKDFYQERGYNKIQIEVAEGLKQSDRGAVFRIHEGPQQRIWTVKFVGNTIVSGGRLKTQIQSKPSKVKLVTPLAKGYVDRRSIDEDVDRLTSYYRSLGYMVARVGRLLKFDDDGRWAELTFVIDEGPHFVVRSVTFSGNEIYDDAQLQALLSLKSGEYFDQAKMTRDVRELTDAYGSVGFIMANVKPEPRTLERDPEVDLVFDIAEGDRYRVGEIHVTITGDSPHTQRSVALDRISIRPGDIADIREIRDSERRLRSSGLFLSDQVRGIQPKIVFRQRDENESMADHGQSSSTIRGQSPERPRGDHPRARPAQGVYR